MSKYLICALKEYELGVDDEVKLDVTVKKHAPIYSVDGSEVLVKGLGEMTLAEVKAYQSTSDAWKAEDES